MSIKSLFQVLVFCLIIMIIGGVYFKYFNNKENIVEVSSILENDNLEQIKKLENKLLNLEIKNQELNEKISDSIVKNKGVLTEKKLELKGEVNKNKKLESKNNLKIENKEVDKEVDKEIIKNLVKNVEYTSVDEKGNRFYLLANSGRSNANNKDILDLDNVRGKITSEKRDTIYIVSDYAQYDTVNLNSKFYENVIIDYQDKKINCLNFDINMDTDKAVAYNDVVITDPKSIMKAGIVEFDLKTKDIFINPKNTSSDIKVITN